MTIFTCLSLLLLAVSSPLFASQKLIETAKQRESKQLTKINMLNEQKNIAENKKLKEFAKNAGMDVDSNSNKEIRKLFDTFPADIQQLVVQYLEGDYIFLTHCLQHNYYVGLESFEDVFVECNGKELKMHINNKQQRYSLAWVLGDPLYAFSSGHNVYDSQGVLGLDPYPFIKQNIIDLRSTTTEVKDDIEKYTCDQAYRILFKKKNPYGLSENLVEVYVDKSKLLKAVLSSKVVTAKILDCVVS